MGIKGHVAIELKNVETGEVKHIEADNMVTNAIHDYAQLLSYCATTFEVNKIMPLYKKGLAGLLLFDTPITEDANSYSLENDAIHVVGSAGPTTDVSHADSGTYNELESGKTQTGYKLVWDFSTSQLNSQISALSLTHIAAIDWLRDNSYDSNLGLEMLTFRSDTNRLGGSCLIDPMLGLPYHIDESTGTCYSVGIQKGETNNDVIITIYATNPPIYKFKVADSLDTLGAETLRVVNSVNKTLSFQLPSEYYSDGEYAKSAFYIDNIDKIFSKADDGYLYVIIQQNSSPCTNFAIFKINIATSQITYQDYVAPISLSSYTQWIKVINNYMYVAQDSGTYRKLYKFNLSDASDYTDLTLDWNAHINTEFGLACWYGNKLKIIPDSHHPVYLVDPNDFSKVKISHNNADYYGSAGLYINRHFWYKPAQGWNRVGVRVYIRRDYLGTIFNLSSPITKTAAQTMKIIYTLTDAS